MTDFSNSSQDRHEYNNEPEDPKAQSFNKIDLSNQKADNVVEATNQQVFSATANQFLAVSGNSSQGIIVNPTIQNQQTIHNFASGANSPTGLSSITMQTFSHIPQGMSHASSAMGPHPDAAQMQMLVNQANQQASNLKAATTHNTNQLNYFSNLQASQVQGTQDAGANTSLGRVTGKIETGSNDGKRTVPAKSGILAQSGAQKQSNTTGMKRVPSRTKITEKNGRKLNYRTGPSQQTQSDQVDVPVVNHQQSRSQGKNQNRGTSQSNRVMQQDAQAMLQQNVFQANGNLGNNGEMYQGFQFVQMGQNPSFQFSQQPNMQQMQPGQLSQQQQQMLATGGYQIQPQPQVHFIAKQQKFYGISPERAPMIFNNGQQQSDKRPYTSSGQAIGKQRGNLNKVHNSAIAALYLGGQKGMNTAGQGQQRNSSQPNQEVPSGLAAHQSQVAAYSMHSIPAKTGKRTIQQANSAAAARKQQSNIVYGPGNQFTAKESEALYDEAIKMKQLANMHKDENIKLKTKIKILENEMGRKERTLEDFFQQNQFIQNAQKNQAANTGPLAPIAQTAQRYQQETFLVMSLKKQVKELKQVNEKKEEELSNCKKNIKQTRFFEAEQEIKVYKDELIRLRYLLEQQMSTRDIRSHAAMQAHGSQPDKLTTSQSLVGQKMTTSQSTTENTVKPPLMIGFQMNSETTADNVSSQDEKLPLLKTGSATINQQQQMLLTGINGFSNQPLYEQTTPVVSNPLSTNGFSSIDQREYKYGDSELNQILSSQISDRDATIKAMQQQIDDLKRRSLLKGDNSVTPDKEAVEDTKLKVQNKEALAKLKKTVKDKEKEILKLKQEISNAASINAKFTETNEEENSKKIKKLEVQVSTYLKKTQDLKSDAARKDGKIDQLNKDLEKASTEVKQSSEKAKKETTNSKKLQKQVDELQKQIETLKSAPNSKPTQAESSKVEKQINNVSEAVELSSEANKNQETSENVAKEPKMKEENKKEQAKNEDRKEEDESIELDEKAEGELCLTATVLGCRNNKDRIEFAQYIKEHVKNQKGKQSKEDDLIILSQELIDYVEKEKTDKLALVLPKYEYITPSLGLVILGDIRKMLVGKELLDILSEKETEEKLPFDALRDLCAKFERHFSDEQCAFICSTYLVQIDTGVIYINFAHFLNDVKDFDLTALKSNESKSPRRNSLGPNSDLESDSGKDLKKKGLGAHLAKRDGTHGKKKSFDEEQMLDIAEACFIRMAELMVQRGRTVRGIFTKYSVPEMFPDRTVLELLNPINFLEGVREAGLDDLQEMEAACLMRVLSKPELDNAIILNELVLIMENFGVMDQLDDDEADDYIPDTETDVEKSVAEEKEIEEKKDEKKVKDEVKEKKPKDKKRAHNLANIDAKGIKILRKLARYLLKQFLHPREFFGKAIKKEQFKTKKREFSLDVIKIKDFYLKIKIANIRKKLTENESLNLELCLDKKMHKDLFNVKHMVKALEELAEEEQAVLIKEEQELKKKKDEKDKEKVSLTAITESEPDTPRSDSKETDTKESKPDTNTESKEKSKESEYAGGISESIKFGNSRIHSNSAPNSGRSPLTGSGAYHQLNTIEEEKHETQTSNYIDGASEREDSKLLGSNNLRGSNFMKDFDLDEEQKKSLSKLSPDILNKSLLKDEVRQSLFDEVQVNKPESLNSAKETKDKKLSQSVAETSVNRFKEVGKSEGGSNDGEGEQAK